MCIRDSLQHLYEKLHVSPDDERHGEWGPPFNSRTRAVYLAVSYTHLRAHETVLDLVCRLLLEKKKKLTTLLHSVTRSAHVGVVLISYITYTSV